MDKRKQTNSILVERARAVLRGQAMEAGEVDRLARELIAADLHYWARRLLLKVLARGDIERAQRIRLVQGLALATYKDHGLLQLQAFDRALELLAAEFDLPTTRDQETLGLVGALYKRRWRIDSRRQWLEQSLHYYRRGFECGVAGDGGYTAINAAYIQDVLAWLESGSCHASNAIDSARARHDDALAIRRQVIDALTERLPSPAQVTTEDYWLLATLAEAHLGVGDSERTDSLLAQAARLHGVPDWWRKSTVEQLVHLVQVQSPREDPDTIRDTPAWRALIPLLGESSARAAHTLAAGKVGLALSGGGFRASLYHLGVLARLAELDMLRHLEVLSCVSGGSIVGAHYYLELRRLLQFTRHRDDPTRRGLGDAEISQRDYLDLVDKLIDDFLDGVQQNLRMRVLANPLANLKMLFLPTYSRTEYLGELYEQHLYSRVDDDGEQRRYLDGLAIRPPDEAEGFRPGDVNWRRCHKIPQLVLNATTLNTGHLWQFTVSWMGESPNIVNREFDKNPRLRRLYYQEAPEPRYRHFRLGHAVAASSCVPGLFEPLELPRLYARSNIRLVDGGVYDNLGVAALTEQDCAVMIVSDASGQLSADDDPAGGILGPVLRSMSVMMGRIRGSEYEDLHARKESVLLKGMTYVHLTQGLEGRELDWKGSGVPADPAAAAPVTRYGIRKEVQQRLAMMRTDLDSFTDVEAFALMNSGYHAMSAAAGELRAFPLVRDVTRPWPFRELDAAMQSADAPGNGLGAAALDRHLAVSHLKFFKVWHLSAALKALAVALALLLVGGVGYWFIDGLRAHPQLSLLETAPMQALWGWLANALTLRNLAGGGVLLLVGYLVLALFGQRFGKRIMQFFRLRSILRRAAIGVGIGLIGWILPMLHLALFDRLFLRLGRLRSQPRKGAVMTSADGTP
jgi:predicted acylesterase/phospholipase RssA